MSHAEFTIPARGLIGPHATAERHQRRERHASQLLRLPAAQGSIPSRVNGVMISTEMGRTTAHALENLQERGWLFVGASEQVYEGQIVGEHCRDNDLPVNVCREKKLTNVRNANSEKTIILKPPRQLTLELALEYIEDDELVEITPAAIRLRKSMLKEKRHGFNRQEKN